MNYIDAILKNAPNGVFKNRESEIIIRCPYCGDSVKDPRHAHLYVSKYDLPGYNTPMYHCMRCGASGPIRKLLRKLQIPTSDVDISATVNLSEISNPVSFRRSNTNPNKIEYVKHRLGLDELPKWIDNTIVDTVSIENNTIFTAVLNRYFVGFRSYNYHRANFRNTGEGFRYVTLNRTPQRDFYITYPKRPNFLKPGTIIIAEGVFSLLRGYFSLLKLGYINKNQVLLTASWSKKSLNTCLKYVVSYFGIFDWNIILLADKDLDNYIIKFPCTILHNKRHSDFGEECKQIKETVHNPRNNFLRRIS